MPDYCLNRLQKKMNSAVHIFCSLPKFHHISVENIEVSKYINIAFQNQLKYMDDRKLAEFNYNIINNILINKAYLRKWISETSDTIHLLYDCSFNDHIWEIVGNCLQLNITYKHVVLGYSSKLCHTIINIKHE